VLVDRQIVCEEKLLLDRGLQETEIDRRARAEFGEVEFVQPIVEPLEPGHFRIDREPRVLADPAIVFMKAESGGLQRPGREITPNKFIRDAVQFGVRF
jgi:hypothetical protein